MGIITGKKRPDEKGPPDRLHFDKLLFTFSSRCMNATPHELDNIINESLTYMARYFGIDRTTLWEYSDDGEKAALKYSFAQSGAEPPQTILLHETLPYISDQADACRCVRLTWRIFLLIRTYIT